MTARFRVLVTDRAWPDTLLEQEIADEVGAEIIEPYAPGEAALLQLAPSVDAIATNWAKVSDTVIRASRKCRIVARFGIGVDNIAVDTATELGIPVTNCPDYCVGEVSDHALGLLLACARRIAVFQRRALSGEYNLALPQPIQRIAGQTIGLVGLGHIAQALIPKVKALSLNVIAHTASSNDRGTGVPMVSFNDLLATSDFISIHAPLTPQTTRMFNARAFAQMRPTAFLINTSRGGLIDQAALFQALQQRRLAGAALDVFDPEPPDLSQPLFQDERVIVTPHAAFVSEQAIRQLRTEAMQSVVAVLAGRRPTHLLNPQIYHSR